MTYVNKRTRLFLDRSDVKLERRRSEARLKTYLSAIDVRAWCDIVEDRRQHILELINKGNEKCFGRLIPLDAIIRALISRKIADMEKVQKDLAQSVKFIEGLNLSEEDKKKFAALKETIGPSLTVKEDGENYGKNQAVQGSEDVDISSYECVATQRHADELKEINSLLETVSEGGRGAGTGGGGTYKVTAKGPAKIITRVKGVRPALQSVLKMAGSAISSGQGSSKIRPRTKTDDKDSAKQAKTQISFEEHPSRQSTQRQSTGQTSGGFEGRPSRQSTQGQSTGQTSGESRQEKQPLDQSQEQPQKRGQFMEQKDSGQPVSQSLSQKQPENLQQEQLQFQREPIPQASIIEGDNKHLRMNFDVPLNSDDLRIQLEARETLCNELRTALENMKNERDEFRKKLETLLGELEAVKKLNAANSVIPTSCKEEIEALELEIKVMRSGNLSPEQEAEVIRKEVDVLKKYCLKLKSVEDENEKLKLERDNLKSQVTLSDDTGKKKHKSVKDNLNRQVAGILGDDEKRKIETDSSKSVTETYGNADLSETDNSKETLIEELKSKLKNLEQITRERDMLANKVQRLEKELVQYRDLPEDIEVYRNRSKMLDSALEERDKMSKKIEQIKEMEDEMNQLRKRSAKVDELEEELKSFSKNDKNIGSELKKTKSRCTCLEKELQNVKMERDSMRTRIEYMKKEIEMLKGKSKEAEIYKVERDKLQIKANELSHIQVEYENLLLKCKCLENAAAEREIYKQKYEEVLTMECQGDALRSQVEEAKHMEREKNALVKQVGDLESCICDQEEEIKKLMMQIDNLCRNKDDNQCRMRQALASMRAEIEKKDCLIAESEQKLAAVQAQLKSSIQGVSCETTCYKTRIEDLERELKQCQLQNEALRKQLNKNDCSLRGVEKLTKSEYESVAIMKRELDAAKTENKRLREIASKMVTLTGDEHLQTMLKQSQCAVRRVVEELGRQYKEWDNMKQNQKGIFGQVSKQCPCKYKHMEGHCQSDSESEKLKEELEDIQREKDKLEQLVRQIRNDKVCECPKDQIALLKTDNAKLQEQLKEELGKRKDLEGKLKSTG